MNVANDDQSLETGTWETHYQGRTAVFVRCVRIEVVSGPDTGLGVTFSHPIIRVGSHRSCDIVLADRRVSRFHCEILLEEDGYRVRDLGSTNGTTMAGLRVSDAYWPPGTRLRVGESELMLIALGTSAEVELYEGEQYYGLVGGSIAMRRLYARLERIAPTDTTVLIAGETGSGKELVAEAVHEASPRRTGPLVVVDCGAIPPQLFESELFGHERGAFTGAHSQAIGAFERAHGGTLFLDEIGELPLDQQAKLLRAVESRRIRRVGGDQDIDCNVRLITATNRDLAVEVNRRAFRSDLYYRLAVAMVHVPPLRTRREDIPTLVEFFLRKLGAGPEALSAELMEDFSRHGWPGNVRELRNAVERALVAPQTAAIERASTESGGDLDSYVESNLSYKDARRRLEDDFDRRFLAQLLDEHNWNVSAVARAAGLDRVTVYKMLSRLGLERPS